MIREALDWSKYKEPFVLPVKGEHPRLLIKKGDIERIKQSFEKPQNRCAYYEFKGLCDDDIKNKRINNKSHDSKLLGQIEAYAFWYLISEDTEYARCAYDAVVKYLSGFGYEGYGDYTRLIGHAIFTASEVYDWCYGVLGADEKENIIKLCEDIAKNMEVGYPPAGQGAVCGHGGEAQLLRDLLSFGVAVYDEYEDIYRFCAGRIFDEFVAPRNYIAKSHTHHQGSAYGHYRYCFELWCEAIIYKMSKKRVFAPDFAKIAYEWLYIRRPDGQFFRIGDDFQENKLYKNQYWDEDYPALFLAANLYLDEYIKQAVITESEGFSRFIYENETLTPVQYLILNEPDLWGKPIAELPKTKYFGSPEGMMIARSGWDKDINTDKYGNMDINGESVIAYMRIGERWFGNHQHLDAGNFQLYYKGILASESGCYDSYYSKHDKAYNKETIAHNTLLIYDENEDFFDRPNCGGQRRPTLGEPQTYEEVMEERFCTGKVLSHAYGPDKINPLYSHISGDIADAYSDKASEVLRSMSFMTLEGKAHKGVLFVADKVSVRDECFKKTALVHMQEQPYVNDNIVYVNNTSAEHRGAMQMHILLPQRAEIKKVGGEGKEFLINTENYPILDKDKNFSAVGALEAGAWRIEISGKDKNKTDYMLSVLLVGDIEENKEAAPVKKIECETHFGSQAYDKVFMASRYSERQTEACFYMENIGYAEADVLLCGMAEGKYEIESNCKKYAYADSEGGEIWFRAHTGKVSVRRVND